MDEIDTFIRQGFGKAIGFGDRPALVVVDFCVGYDDPNVFGGGNIHEAVVKTRPLLELCRQHGHPVAYTRMVFADDASDQNMFAKKVPGILALTENCSEGQIVPLLAPRPGEYIVRKRNASAFFATDLAGWLTWQGVDTLLIVGCTTSGCVRASVVDALGYGFRPIVVTDCCGDRAIGPHNASLFDIGQKYGDLMNCHEVELELTRTSRSSV